MIDEAAGRGAEGTSHGLNLRPARRAGKKKIPDTFSCPQKTQGRGNRQEGRTGPDRKRHFPNEGRKIAQRTEDYAELFLKK